MTLPVVLPRERRGYRPIADYGATGDGRSVALVSQTGSIDWWCPGRFDAPSVFGAILDSAHGGSFGVEPLGQGVSRSRYVPDTNVLETEHERPGGRLRVVDFSPMPEDTGVEEGVLVRRIQGLEGAVELDVEFAPRFQYGRIAPRFTVAPHGLLARGGGEILLLRGVDLPTKVAAGRARRLTLQAGERLDLILRHRPFDVPLPFAEPLRHDAATLEALTIQRWREWSQRTRFDGVDAPAVRRAALTLKLLQHQPGGAIVAAATTSLPEAIGGVRNWDYRYAWVRDAALSARALKEVGHDEEADAFSGWLLNLLHAAPEDMRIMYTVGGELEMPEKSLEHLEGYERSVPVRVGNAAATQRQLDVYGELMDYLHATREPILDPRRWAIVQRLADWVARHWKEPDSGIWEMRCAPRHFVLSKAMAWVALERAIALAEHASLPGDVARWRAESDAIRAEVHEKGFDPDTGAFVQAYGFPYLDASNLLLPIVGFVEAKDPRMVATVERTMERLMVNGLVYRYLDAGDGLPGGEATFAYCTFWLVEVLAMQGRVSEARALFDSLLRRANHLGLYAEEIDPTTEAHLGNFPQGFPHAGLITAALALRRAGSG